MMLVGYRVAYHQDPALTLGGILIDLIIFVLAPLKKCLTIQNLINSITMAVVIVILPRTEFGWDTSRLDYFHANPLEVSYDLETDESNYYGGGSGQQQSALTGNFDTSDLYLDDGTRSQEESISTACLGTTENAMLKKPILVTILK
nr:hypothetical protein [Tanacetum cinerariifolium]